MPELPEVEITTQNLNKIMQPTMFVEAVTFFRKDLRHKIPVQKFKALHGKAIQRIYRRAKFIIFEFSEASIISHLGMTGSWRAEKANYEKRKHDHIEIKVNADKYLVFNDPRRFGEFNYFESAKVQNRFKNFGSEPLDPEINWVNTTRQFKKMKSAIKTVLMNQKYLVGVGNIYASEALYRAGIRPTKKAHLITHDQYLVLWQQVQVVLKLAIEAGGSTLQDYRNGFGEKGNFQNRFLVYDREGKLCEKCHQPIKMQFLSGRSTYWCSKCQK